MIRRILWFVSGVATGVYGVVYGLRKVKHSTEAMKPVNVARDVAERTRGRVGQFSEALRAGRDAMREKELQLRAESGQGVEGTEVVSVEPGRVVVLRPNAGRNARTQRR